MCIFTHIFTTREASRVKEFKKSWAEVNAAYEEIFPRAIGSLALTEIKSPGTH
jgi:hypothetical protein